MGVVAFLVLVYVGSGGAPIGSSGVGTPLPPLGGGVVGGVFVAAAAAAAVVSWRRHAGPAAGWSVATGALVAGQSLAVTVIALESPPPRGAGSLGLLLLVAVGGLLVVLPPLLRHRAPAHVIDDGFAVGLGTGLVGAAHLMVQVPMASPPARTLGVVFGVVIATHLTATALAVHRGALKRRRNWLLVVTTLVVDVSLVVHFGGFHSTTWAVLTAVAGAAVGAAWLGIAWITLLRSIEEDRRRLTSVEHALVSTTRDQRERMHELRSTVAGLVSGSAMLDRPDVPAETRQQLWMSVRRELDRMDRLLAGQDDGAADVDLDEALRMILDLQRLKGRHVEFRSNGDVVRTRFDALAEVVNILMDNAEKHGGSDHSVVEVVRRDEENVDITVTDFGCGIPADQRTTIFEWGKRGSRSTGEGIGLHLAQRLMTEDGGSLRLAEDQGTGSSFVITLPRTRRSSENHLELKA
ncbi:MAG TPA: HAMP domain-containing sensor histidine kinase [Nocardioides sp.]|nr:HAMP domain-containing sensor histidine kinase [Nocardioides sp.]